MKKILSAVLIVSMLLSALLVSCDRKEDPDEIFGTRETKKKTHATRASTEAPVEVEIPHLVPEILEENTKLVISRLTEPVIRPITEDVSIALNYQGWPTVCAGDGNTLYAVSSVRLAHIDPFGCIGFFKSEDGGETWTDVRIIADTATDDRDAGVVYLGNGRVLVSWFTHSISNYLRGGAYYDDWAGHPNITQAHHEALYEMVGKASAYSTQSASYVMLSNDYGETWESPVQVPVSAPHGPTLMQDGKTLLYFGDLHNPTACGVTGLSANMFYVFKSLDYGRSWVRTASLSLPTVSGVFYDEPHILQLQDGSFIAGIRGQDSNGLYCFIARSQDGRKWSSFQKLANVNGTPPHFFQTKEGILVVSYSYRSYPCGARGKLSYDGGETWSEEIVFSESDTPYYGDLGYASTTQLPDGTMITAYYQIKEMDGYCSLLFTRWRLVEDED